MPATTGLIGAFVVALLAASAGAARAQDSQPDLAFGAYQRGHYRTAFEEATKRIERDNNDGAAMALLGQLTASGLSVTPDLKKGAEWFELAAIRGDRNAAFALGMMALDGRGVAKDVGRAKALLQRAASAGVWLLRQAVQAGLPEAEYAFATLLREGKRVEPDLAAAVHLMGLAARDNYEPAEIEYAIMLFNGEGVAKDEGAAAKLFIRAAARGNPIAENRLARLYVAGRGVPTDLVEAAAWNYLARDAGRADPWLDSAVENLTPEQREKAAALVRMRISSFKLGLTAP
jgi:uncharacterized protein